VKWETGKWEDTMLMGTTVEIYTVADAGNHAALLPEGILINGNYGWIRKNRECGLSHPLLMTKGVNKYMHSRSTQAGISYSLP